MVIRLLKYAVKNILRNKFLSISSIVVLTLLMFFINVLLVVHDISNEIIKNINSKLTISLYLNDKYDKNSPEIIDLMSDLKKWVNWVSVVYKSKDDSLADLSKQDPELVRILERENPLPETIILSNIKLEEYEKLNRIVENKMFVLSEDKKKDLSNYSSQYKRIESVIRVLKMLQTGLYWIIAIFLVSIAIITYSIIWNFIFYYRNEIYITRLVWWWKMFIYWPFSIQWIIYTSISSILSFSIFTIVLKNIDLVFWDLYSFWKLIDWLYLIFFMELVIFMFIWWISWFLSSKKYLK